jgi:hypothetical protein
MGQFRVHHPQEAKESVSLVVDKTSLHPLDTTLGVTGIHCP